MFEPRSPRFYPTKPCRIVVVNQAEYLTTMTAAHRNLQSDGVVADIVSLPNTNTITLDTNCNELNKTIHDINRTIDHALYRGNVYSRPDGARMTFVHLMAMNSHLQHLLSNDSLRERVFKHMSTLCRTLGPPHCSIIKRLELDNDLIEVSKYLNSLVYSLPNTTACLR